MIQKIHQLLFILWLLNLKLNLYNYGMIDIYMIKYQVYGNIHHYIYIKVLPMLKLMQKNKDIMLIKIHLIFKWNLDINHLLEKNKNN